MHRLLIALPLALSSVAFANPTADAEAKATVSFAELDKNADAKLSAEEVASDEALTGSFATVDADGDKSLSRTEFDAWTKVQKEGKADKPAGDKPAKTDEAPAKTK